MSGTRVRVARRLAAALAAGDGAQTAHEPLGSEECATDSTWLHTHPGELAEAFGGRQRELSDRAERCLQGTLRDRALLREVEKLMREVEAYEEDDADDGHGGAELVSAAATRASRPTGRAGLPPSSSRRQGSGGWQTDRSGAGSSVRGAASGAATAVRSCYRPTSARDSEASADARTPDGLIARRLAKADALQSRLSEAAKGSARLEVELDLALDSNARLQRRLDDALQVRSHTHAPPPSPHPTLSAPVHLPACGGPPPPASPHPLPSAVLLSVLRRRHCARAGSEAAHTASLRTGGRGRGGGGGARGAAAAPEAPAAAPIRRADAGRRGA